MRGCLARSSSYSTQILIMDIIKEGDCRSRFALFICCVASGRKGERQRCTEPSRVPVKQLKRFLKKRKLRKRTRNYILKNLPKSSRVYQIIQTSLLPKKLSLAMASE